MPAFARPRVLISENMTSTGAARLRAKPVG